MQFAESSIRDGLVNSCQHCNTRARMLARRATYTRQRHLDSLATGFFHYVSADLFTIPDGKKAIGLSYILVLIDHFSDALVAWFGPWIQLIPLHKTRRILSGPRFQRSDSIPCRPDIRRRRSAREHRALRRIMTEMKLDFLAREHVKRMTTGIFLDRQSLSRLTVSFIE